MIVIPSESKHFKYFTDFEAAGCYLIKKDMEDDGKIISSEMELKRIKEEWEDVEKGTLSDLVKLVKDNKLKEIKVSFDISKKLAQTFESEKIKLIDCEQDIWKLRMIKFPEERKAIKEAEKMCTDLWFDLEKVVKKYNEQDTATWIKKQIYEMEADISFEPIIAYDENSRFPHHVPTDKKCKDIALVDFGAKVAGYCSDVTLTIGFKPEINRRIDGMVTAWDEIKTLITVGAGINRICSMANEIIKNNVKGHEKMIHSLGHSIGMDVHEEPSLRITNKMNIKKGMVFALEPATYDKYGIRFEKEIYV